MQTQGRVLPRLDPVVTNANQWCAAGDGGGVEWLLTERITMANEAHKGVSKNWARGAKRAAPVGFLNPPSAMNLAPRILLSCLALFFALPSCSSDQPLAGSASARPSEGATSVASVPGLARQLGASFQRHVPSATRPMPGMPDKQEREPFFAHAWNAEFRTEHDGSISAVTKDESPANIPGAHFRDTAANQRLMSRFPATAAGDLEVTVGDKPGAWIHERIASASGESRVQLSEGRVVYAGAKPGLDRIYEVSGQRVEEYLRLADEGALQQVAYEVEVGPAIADLVVDGSGHGLMAVDSAGKQVLKAPQPTGVDSQGHGVQGTLVAEKTSERHYRVRVVLDGTGIGFPVLLDPSWVSAASMADTRLHHSATLLPNGKVLVVGGGGSAFLHASAELYDAGTNTWSSAASMATSREFHATALLQNGKVLITGGSGATGTLSDSALYDVGANTWLTVPAMASARRFCTATLLQNGNVLVVGGTDGNFTVSSAELYDAGTNTWSSAASMATPRESHTATLLPNGKVLVAGGWSNNNGLASVELYDAGTNTWTPVASMATARSTPTATLLQNGKVLVAGGASTEALSSAELYDAGTNTWSPTASMTDARYYQHTATRLQNGKVLVAGGYGVGAVELASVELYDPLPGTWSTGSLAGPRRFHTSSLLPDGRVLVAGGWDGHVALSSGELGTYPQLANGVACQSSVDCISAFCVDGVCCGTACAGGCDVCAQALGASADGVCTLVSVGLVGECAPFVCSGTATCPAACTSDSQCVSDHYCDNTGACVPQKPQGSTCSPDPATDCFEANCRECDTGHCTGGFCCDQACKDGCDVCTATQGATANGVCTTLGAGKPGSPSCAPFVCDGMSQSCPTTCQDAGDCTSTAFCNNGLCESTGQSGALCSSGIECASTFCVDGVCCNEPCEGACEACSSGTKESGTNSGICGAALKGSNPRDLCEAHPATDPCGEIAECSNDRTCAKEPQTTACGMTTCSATFLSGSFCNGLGQCLETSTPVDCAPYQCVVDACANPCETDDDCVSGFRCLSNGLCSAKKNPGESCMNAEECGSTFCVDQVCCDSPCTGQCEFCASSGSTGQCKPVDSGQPLGGRETCTGKGTTCGGECKGDATSCSYPAQGKTCDDGDKCDGDSAFAGLQCDGAGQCIGKTPKSCAPFTCDSDLGNCKTSCITSSDCSEGAVCSSTGLCTLGEDTCSNKTTITQADGSLIDCSPFICQAGQCTATCSANSDCASTASCTNGQCVDSSGEGGQSGSGGASGANSAAAAPKDEAGCGCRVTGPDSSSQDGLRAMAVMALLGFAGARRGRK